MNAKKYISALMMTVIALMLLIACGGGQQREVFRTDSKGNTVPVADYVCVAVDETF